MNSALRRLGRCRLTQFQQNVLFLSRTQTMNCSHINTKVQTYSNGKIGHILSPAFMTRTFVSLNDKHHKCFLRLSEGSHNALLTSSMHQLNVRLMSSINRRNPSTVYYIVSAAIVMVGVSFAGVPLYKIFCQTTGFGGETQVNRDGEKISEMETVEERLITGRFTADVASSMRWNFKPQQQQVVVHPGETALAFYTARNPTDISIVGISTYNITPYDAGIYFNKIQCFCFEEQRLKPHEQVDMPVFFYIDPEFVEDPKMERVNTVTLSYTFFEATEGFELPIPKYLRPHSLKQ